MLNPRLILAVSLLLGGCSVYIIPTGPGPFAMAPTGATGQAGTPQQVGQAATPTPAPAGGPLTLSNGAVIELKLNGKAMHFADRFTPTNWGYAKRWDFGNTTVAGGGIKADGEVGVSWQITIHSTGLTEEYHEVGIYLKDEHVLFVQGYLSKPNSDRLPGALTFSVADKKIDLGYTGKLMSGQEVTSDEVVLSIKGLPDF